MKRNAGRRILGCCIALVLMLFSGAAQAAENVGEDVENSLTYLLNLATDKGAGVDVGKIAPLLSFAQTMPVSGKTGDLPLKERDFGEGVAVKEEYKSSLAKFLEYYFNPRIPSAIVYPNSVRMLKWYPGSQIASHRPYLWETKNFDEPLVLRGEEFEEITPDANSGSFYSYPLARMVILLRHEGKLFFITVSKQTKRSNVGLKGAIVGDDDDWNYVYTGESGATRGGIGWMDTYVYNSATVGVFYADSMQASVLDNVAFKWLKAGWKGINVVKQSHIRAGLSRYESALRLVLESPKMPSPSALEAECAKVRAMTDDELKASLQGYAAGLEKAIPGNDILSRDEFRKVLRDGGYAQTLSRDHLVNQALLNFVRAAFGKYDPKTGLAPHAQAK